MNAPLSLNKLLGFSHRKRRLVDGIASGESGPVERDPKQPLGVPVLAEVALLV